MVYTTEFPDTFAHFGAHDGNGELRPTDGGYKLRRRQESRTRRGFASGNKLSLDGRGTLEGLVPGLRMEWSVGDT